MALPPGYTYDYSGNPSDPDIVPITQASGSPSQSSSSYTQRSILDYDGSWQSAADIFRTAIDKNDTATIDKIVNYWREDSLRRAQYDREDHAYSRLAADLRSIGINPVSLMQGSSPMSSPFSELSSGNSYSTAKTQAETSRHNKQSEQWNIASTILGALMSMLVIAAVSL